MDFCLVVLTDTLYLPGTRKTVATWMSHNGLCPLVILSADTVVFDDPYLKSLEPRNVAIDSERYADIRPYKKRHSQRHGQTFLKFEAFGDFGYERNLFLDSDILCLKAAPQLVEPTAFPLRAALDTGFRPTRAYRGHAQEFNSGVLSIDRSLQGENTIEQLRAIARTNPGRGGYNAGDQGILNKWIHQARVSVERLSSDYNLIKKDYADESGLEACKLLHFAGRKPWFERKADADPGPASAVLETLWDDC